jgi:hypothetical protein
MITMNGKYKSGRCLTNPVCKYSPRICSKRKKNHRMTLKIAGKEVTITISFILNADPESSYVHKNKLCGSELRTAIPRHQPEFC